MGQEKERWKGTWDKGQERVAKGQGTGDKGGGRSSWRADASSALCLWPGRAHELDAPDWAVVVERQFGLDKGGSVATENPDVRIRRQRARAHQHQKRGCDGDG